METGPPDERPTLVTSPSATAAQRAIPFPFECSFDIRLHTAKLTWHAELSLDLGRISPSMPSPCHRQDCRTRKQERGAHGRSYWIAGKRGAHETLSVWCQWGKDGKDNEPTETGHPHSSYGLALPARHRYAEAIPTRPGIGAWEREVPRATQGAAQARPLPTLRHAAISVASYDIALYL